jgi:hypothetical protein
MGSTVFANLIAVSTEVHCFVKDSVPSTCSMFQGAWIILLGSFLWP